MNTATEIFNATVTGTVSGTASAIANDAPGLGIAVVATAPVSLTSCDGVIEHSPDGSTWFTLATITQIAAATTEFIAVETSRFSNLRFRVTAIVGTSVDVAVLAE